MAFKIGWFSTGRDEAARQLFQVVYDATQSGLIKAQVEVVFSNREQGESGESDRFFDLVQSKEIPIIHFSSARFRPDLWEEGRADREKREKWRLLFDKEVIKRLRHHPFDLAVLAGYMLIIGFQMCRVYRMINLHPAAPGGPAGTWQEVIWRLIKTDASETGVMMHLVTPELDRGPVATYVTFPIKGEVFDPLWQNLKEKLKKKSFDEVMVEEGEKEPLFAEIRRQGIRRELPLILFTLKKFAEKKIEADNGKIVAGGRVLDKGFCLNREVETYLQEEER